MAAGNTIEAKLRIAAEVAQAITALKSVRKELLETSKAAADAGAATPTAGQPRAPRADADPVVQQTKARSAAERQAAAERKRLDREELDAQKAKARETKKIADEEERARRKKERDETAARRQRDAEEKRASRGKSYQAAALAPQLNDIFVGATTGQSPLTVALQQGPQIVQIYGGVRNTFAALLSVLTPLRVAIGAVAGGFALLGINAASGYRETSQLNKALALSGNIANTSRGQINDLALDISDKTSTSISFVREVLAQLITVNGQTDKTLGATGRAVTALAKLTGQSAEEAVKSFEDQAEGVTAWSIKANRAYNFLTAAQVERIRSLEREGKTAEAIRQVNEELAKTLGERAVGAIGLVEKAYNAAAKAVSGFLDMLKAVGRDETAEEKAKRLQEALKDIEERISRGDTSKVSFGGRTGTNEQIRARVQAELDALKVAEDARAKEAAAAKKNAEDIKRLGKEFRQVEANATVAAAQLALARKQEALDREQDLVEQAYARQRLSADDQARQLNAIEQKRAQAELEFLRAQQTAQAQVIGNKPEDKKAEEASANQIRAQIATAESKLKSAVADGSRQVDAQVARLDRELLEREADALSARAERTVDPEERARLAAQAATAQARRELADLQRDLKNSQDSAAPEGIQLRNQQLVDEARKSLDEITRRAKLDSIVQQTSQVQQALELAERGIDQLVEAGTLTTIEGERKKNDEREKSLVKLRELLDLQRQLADPRNAGEANGLTQATQQIRDLELAGDKAARSFKASIAGGFSDAFDSIVTGSRTAGQAIKDFVGGIARSMLNIISKNLGEQLVNSLFKGSGGTGSGIDLGAFFASFFQASVKHTGGLITAAGGATRAVSPLLFAGAQVLHSGGLVQQATAGLRSNEVPVIAEVGEEMVTEDNPRHIKNYRGNGVNMQVNIAVNGAGGAEQEQVAQLEMLQQMMLATVEQWAAKQRRQGGILAGGARG